MSDVVQIKQARTRHRERELANLRAVAGAGVGEDEILAAMNRPHVAVLEQPLGGGALEIHLGPAVHGSGVPLCTAENPRRCRESLGAFRSPYFSMKLPERQRIWCGIVWLEQNRGCPVCIERAYLYADREGWPQPKRLGELLGLGEALGPERGSSGSSGPRLTRQGFIRGTG